MKVLVNSDPCNLLVRPAARASFRPDHLFLPPSRAGGVKVALSAHPKGSTLMLMSTRAISMRRVNSTQTRKALGRSAAKGAAAAL